MTNRQLLNAYKRSFDSTFDRIDALKAELKAKSDELGEALRISANNCPYKRETLAAMLKIPKHSLNNWLHGGCLLQPYRAAQILNITEPEP